MVRVKTPGKSHPNPKVGTKTPRKSCPYQGSSKHEKGPQSTGSKQSNGNKWQQMATKEASLKKPFLLQLISGDDGNAFGRGLHILRLQSTSSLVTILLASKSKSPKRPNGSGQPEAAKQKQPQRSGQTKAAQQKRPIHIYIYIYICSSSTYNHSYMCIYIYMYICDYIYMRERERE